MYILCICIYRYAYVYTYMYIAFCTGGGKGTTPGEKQGLKKEIPQRILFVCWSKQNCKAELERWH